MSNHQRGIQTVELAGEILKLVCSSPQALSLSEIAETMQLAPGSAYKYLLSLLRTGLLKRNENTLAFEAGPLSLRLGLSKIHHDTILQYARQALTELADQYHLNVFAAMWSNQNGPTVVFYKQAGGFFHIGFRLGIRLSLNGTASGRIFAAYMPTAPLHHYVEQLDPDQQQHFEHAEFQQQLTQIRTDGYSYLMGTPTPGISSFSVPVFDRTGQFMMAITAFHKSEMMNAEIETALIQDLQRIAAALKELQHG